MAEVRPLGFRSAIYRPFFRQHYYMDRVLIKRACLFWRTQIPLVFPHTRIMPAILPIIVERGLRTPRAYASCGSFAS